MVLCVLRGITSARTRPRPTGARGIYAGVPLSKKAVLAAPAASRHQASVGTFSHSTPHLVPSSATWRYLPNVTIGNKLVSLPLRSPGAKYRLESRRYKARHHFSVKSGTLRIVFQSMDTQYSPLSLNDHSPAPFDRVLPLPPRLYAVNLPLASFVHCLDAPVGTQKVLIETPG